MKICLNILKTKKREIPFHSDKIIMIFWVSYLMYFSSFLLPHISNSLFLWSIIQIIFTVKASADDDVNDEEDKKIFFLYIICNLPSPFYTFYMLNNINTNKNKIISANKRLFCRKPSYIKRGRWENLRVDKQKKVSIIIKNCKMAKIYNNEKKEKLNII